MGYNDILNGFNINKNHFLQKIKVEKILLYIVYDNVLKIAKNFFNTYMVKLFLIIKSFFEKKDYST